MSFRLLNFLFIATSLIACNVKKPFQPPPPEYTQWVKEGVTDETIRQNMKLCGYKDLYGYGDKTSNNEAAKQEQCMFSSGYKRKGSYQGVCTLSGKETLPACNK